MRITQNLGRSDTQANDLISGFVSTGSDWSEDVIIPDGKITSADTFVWEFNFRCDRSNTSNDLSLTTVAASLVISQGSTTTTVQIRADRDDLTNLSGNYFADLVYQDGSGNRIHQAHGMITFNNEPIW